MEPLLCRIHTPSERHLQRTLVAKSRLFSLAKKLNTSQALAAQIATSYT